MGAQFVEAEGMVHLIHPDEGGERTLCGDAFDLASDEDGYEWKPTRRRAVDCPKCALVIKRCRGVRVKDYPDARPTLNRLSGEG